MLEAAQSLRPPALPSNALACATVALLLALPAAALLTLAMQGFGAAPDRQAWHDFTWMTLLCFVPCLVPAAHVGSTPIARSDSDVLHPLPPANLISPQAAPLSAVQQRVWVELQAWCLAGAGNGRSPLLRRWAQPEVFVRLGLAVLLGNERAGRSRLAAAFARHLDREDELADLAARSRSAGWRLKLAVKWHELGWWRPRYVRQPWDCGYLADQPAGARARRSSDRAGRR